MSHQSLHGRDATNCNKPEQMQPRSASAGARLLRTSRWGEKQMCPPWKAILNIDWPYYCWHVTGDKSEEVRDEEKAEGDNSTEKLLQEGELCIRTQNDLNDFLRNIDM